MRTYLENALGWYTSFILVFFFAINSYYLVLTLAGFWRTLKVFKEVRRPDQRRLLRSPLTPPVSVLAPAFNEEANVVENVRSLLMLDYPLYEVILVNDGSRDRTLGRLIDAFDLRKSGRTFEQALPNRPIRGVYESPTYPNLVVVDKVNGGKADALNAGLNLSLYPIFCAIDADSILEPDALLRLVRPFVDAPGVTIAAGGVVRVANGCGIHGGRVHQVRLPRPPLPLIQIVEYLRAFLFGRMGWSAGNSLLVISGAFGLFDKRAAIQAGGYATDTVGEDMELVVRMHRNRRERRLPYRIGFVPDPICWTEVPEKFRTLRRQRTRWQRGLIDTLLRHRGMMGRPRYGNVGMIALPGFLVFEMVSPLVEMSGYLLLPLLWW
ncbi:MAG TPA: glycosyltransferase family 2 protein, partial [Gemmatimonadales bacterium]|nr:glycosyltransferase family 2 protein [Gemmatimonadales bacterium]